MKCFFTRRSLESLRHFHASLQFFKKERKESASLILIQSQKTFWTKPPPWSWNVFSCGSQASRPRATLRGRRLKQSSFVLLVERRAARADEQNAAVNWFLRSACGNEAPAFHPHWPASCLRAFIFKFFHAHGARINWHDNPSGTQLPWLRNHWNHQLKTGHH